MVDDGYNNHRIHDATKNNKVLAEYDFIQGDSTTSIGPGDFPGQGNHGMYTYSALSGFKEGTLIGPAYGASFLLAKTEVIGSETPIEEDYYVQGLEWLEQNGADLVSSSLGYIDWYTYDSLRLPRLRPEKEYFSSLQWVTKAGFSLIVVAKLFQA